MPEIRQLDNHVAELIAAGEVVERPASVVKELVENAIDAGATAIAVEVQRGGMGLIRVTDNGCGMAPHQLSTAFLRHATSKLRRAEDLAAIDTLGFRGEALAAIAAVSRLDVFSRERGAETGASLHLEGGEPEDVASAGAPEGTTIVIRDLFFNTPARLKFMKKDSAETAAVLGLMQHLALSHPDISFQMRKDGVEALHTPGDGRAESAVYAALGREFALGLLPVSGRDGEISVTGFISQPLNGRGSRGMQTFFVNGRYIKSQLLTAALEEGYRNQLLKGKFPGCVLQVILPASTVDVNVHPAKTQVKFARDKDVFDAVFHTVLDALETQGGAVSQKAAPSVEQIKHPRGDFFQTMGAKDFRESERPASRPAASVLNPVPPRMPGQPAPVIASSKPASPSPVKPSPHLWDTEWSRVPVRDVTPEPPSYAPSRPVEAHMECDGTAHQSSISLNPFAEECIAPAVAPVPAIAQPALSDELPQQELTLPQTACVPKGEAPWRLVGEVLHTYIIAQDDQENVWLIDKHAAHERMNFDRLKDNSEPVMRQRLIAPAAVQLPAEGYAALLDQLALLGEFGFEAEDFGAGCILIREIPSNIVPEQISETLEFLAEKLLGSRLTDPGAARDAMLHTMACKAAIKGGWTSDEKELQVLVEKVQGGEIRYCPHGRPVAVKMTKYELEKMFKRA